MPVSSGAWDVEVKGLDEAAKVLMNVGRYSNEVVAESMKEVGLKVFKDSIDELNRLVYDQPERGYKRTGALRRSGRLEMIDKGFKISYGGPGTNVDYAQFVEFGTERMEPRPFLRNAVLNNKVMLRKLGNFSGKIISKLRKYGVKAI